MNSFINLVIIKNILLKQLMIKKFKLSQMNLLRKKLVIIYFILKFVKYKVKIILWLKETDAAPVELLDEPVQSETLSAEVATNVDPVEQGTVGVQTETPSSDVVEVVQDLTEVVIPVQNEAVIKEDVEKFLPEIPNHAQCKSKWIIK